MVLVRDETLGGGLVLELCFYFLRIIFLSNTPVIKFSSTLSRNGQLMRRRQPETAHLSGSLVVSAAPAANMGTAAFLEPLAIFCAPSYSSPLDASSMSRP